MPQLHTLSVLVINKPGVLARVSSLISRRDYNIESLAVAPTDDPNFSRINMTVDVESAPLEQITKQLFKLIDVVKISELAPDNSTVRELMMSTVRATTSQRGQVIELVDVFGATIVDVGNESLTVMLAGDPTKLDDFEALLQSFGITDMQRTGRIALAKLEKNSSRLRAVSDRAS